MSGPDEQLHLPPSLEGVEYEGNFQVLERLRRERDIVSLLWREESDVKVVYIHAHDEPTLYRVPSDRVEDAKAHPELYTLSSGYPFEEFVETPRAA